MQRQRYFVHLAYRGTHYRGWQRQSGNTVSVQETIEEIVSRVQGEAVRVVGCGRTDAGVHASDYYLHFDVATPLRDRWLFIVNKLLPDDIVFHRVWPVAANAHVRYDAKERTYDYHIHTRADPFLAPVSSLYALEGCDFESIDAALELLQGHHDFRAFCLTPDRHNTTDCDLRQAIFYREEAGRYRFRFVADRFLRGMIRILVYQLLETGKGKISLSQLEQALAGGERITKGLARPEGLFLSGVKY